MILWTNSASKDKKRGLNEAGFSLVEAVVTTGIIAIIMGSFYVFTSNMYESKSNLSARQEFDYMIDQVILALRSDVSCRLNFANLEMKDGATIKDLTISNFDAAAKPVLPPLAKKGLRGKLIEITDVELKADHQVGTNRWMAILNIRGVRTDTTDNPNAPKMSLNLDQKIPILASSDDLSKVIACSGNLKGQAGLPDRVCALQNDGVYFWDNVTKSCKSRFAQKCFPGTRTRATCGEGSIALVGGGKYICSSDVKDTNTTQFTRIYDDGKERVSRLPRPYQCVTTPDPLTVECTYATDIDSTAAKCSACCEVDLLLNLSAEDLKDAQEVDP